jgi:hypothetical protein
MGSTRGPAYVTSVCSVTCAACGLVEPGGGDLELELGEGLDGSTGGPAQSAGSLS